MAATRSRNTRTGGRLAPLFFPASVAVIGAAREPGKVGHTVLDNILKGGYQGKVLPVNPKAEEIAGLKCYPSIAAAAEAAGTVKLAVNVIPAPLVPDVIEECGAAGVRAAIVISASFRESGREGFLLEQRLLESARRHRVAHGAFLGHKETHGGISRNQLVSEAASITSRPSEIPRRVLEIYSNG